MNQYDITIIGGGPGGYTAAIRAAQLGASICLIEKGRVGGTCLNRGCIPTKSLLCSTEVLAHTKKAADYGVEVQGVSGNLAKMVERKNRIVKKLVDGVEHLLSVNNKIRLIKGTGTIISPTQVKATSKEGGEETIETKTIIIATGSEPAMIPAFGIDKKQVITSTEALNITTPPSSMIVVVGGVIGCEFSCIFSELGTQITILELMPSILPLEDRAIAQRLSASLKRRGIKIKTGVQITEIKKDASSVTAVLKSGDEISADMALVSIGRALNTKGLGLENVGVEQGQRGEISVNERMETNIKGIYAIGDVVGKIMLAHVAATQGAIAAANALGDNLLMDYDVVPSCIFTSPEIGTVGLTQEKAKVLGYEVKVGNFSFMALGKALAMGESEGTVRIVADAKTDQILGAQIFGPHATDLVAEMALAIKNKLTAKQVAETIHAHPTLAEALHEASEDIHDMAIHIAKRRK